MGPITNSSTNFTLSYGNHILNNNLFSYGKLMVPATECFIMTFVVIM